jgi:hypothetical protein
MKILIMKIHQVLINNNLLIKYQLKKMLIKALKIFNEFLSKNNLY